jgi:hypothetical protein
MAVDENPGSFNDPFGLTCHRLTEPAGKKIQENVRDMELNRNSRIRRVVGTVVAVLGLAYGYFYLVSTLNSREDMSECKAITNLVISNHAIPESLSTPGSPGIFCDVEVKGFFLRRFDHLRIYGVTDKSQQDLIIRSLEHSSGQLKARQLVVEFYDRENWKTWSSPARGIRGGERGPESSIRKAVIR